jgi:hypothetical protein
MSQSLDERPPGRKRDHLSISWCLDEYLLMRDTSAALTKSIERVLTT